MKHKITLLISCLFFLSKTILSAQTANPNFGNNGYVVTDFASDLDGFGAMSALPDGKIVLFGTSRISGIAFLGNSNTDGTNNCCVLAMVKYNTDGSLDGSFGVNGKIYYSIDTYQNFTPVCSVAQNDGKIVLGGYSTGLATTRAMLLRFLPDGKQDPSFGVNGITTLDSEYIYDLFLDSNSKILAVGEKSQDACIERINPNGFFDPTFGTLGVSLIDDNGSRLNIKKGRMMSDGSIICFGESSNNSFADTVVFFKFSSNGTYDSSFGIKRIVNSNYENDYDMVQFEVLPDSSLLVLTSGGYVNSNFTNFYHGRLYRIDLNGVTVPSFTNVPFPEVYKAYLKVLNNQNIFVSCTTETSDSLWNVILSPNGNLISQYAPIPAIGSFTSVFFNNYLYVGHGGEDYYVNGFLLDNTLAAGHLNELTCSLSPNPVKDYVTISLDATEDEDSQIEVYNFTGSLIDTYSKKRYEDGKQVFYENISHFASGLYFFKVKSGNGTKTVKVIKN